MTLILSAILLLAGCSDSDLSDNLKPLNTVPAPVTAESTDISEEVSRIPTTSPPTQNPDSGAVFQETPEVTLQPTGYPARIDSSAITSAYPAPQEVIEPTSAYPALSDGESLVPLFGYRIVNQYAHDPESYTQGLVISGDGSEFIEGTGLWGQSSLRRVDIETGDVTQFSALSDQYFGEGLTIFKDRIFQLTWKSNTGFIYDSESFDLLDEFNYAHEGWGITHDGRELIVSDGTATIRFWDPDTLTETKQIQVVDHNGPVLLLNELEYVDGEILANVWQTDKIARISPESGQVVGWIDLSGLFEVDENVSADNVLNGIAYDDQYGRLFVTGKRWPTIFEIEIIPK